jgi:GDP/UDP-N,N'-diacetylbacillosamine 2-epimerase (hydrolysing)
MLEFINAIKAYPNISFIITKSNADKGGDVINSILDREEKKISNIYVFASLGAKRYLSLMKYAEFVIGNSSSGIVETPAMHIPTVNIGDRQKGRLQSESTINCGTSCKEIIGAIEKAMSSEMKSIAAKVESPYGDGNAVEKMTDIILETIKHPIDLKKKFYNLKVD